MIKIQFHSPWLTPKQGVLISAISNMGKKTGKKTQIKVNTIKPARNEERKKAQALRLVFVTGNIVKCYKIEIDYSSTRLFKIHYRSVTK